MTPKLVTPFDTPTIAKAPREYFVKYNASVLEWRKHLSAVDWTVLTVIIDKVYGWGKTSDAVSKSQILDETILGITCIKESLARMTAPNGPLAVIGRGVKNIPIYQIRPCTTGSFGDPFDLAMGSSGDPIALPIRGSFNDPYSSKGSSGDRKSPFGDPTLEERTIGASQNEPVSGGHVVEIPVDSQFVAASTEPPTGMPTNEPAGTKTALNSVNPHTQPTPTVESCLVVGQDVDGVTAPACPGAMPTVSGEPTDTGSPFGLQYQYVRGGEDEDEDEAAWREAAEAQDPEARGTYGPALVEKAKEATAKVAVPEDQKGPVEVMPLGLTIDEKIVWQVRHGESRHYYIAVACKVSQPEVARRMSAMVGKGRLTLTENPRGYTYEVVEDAA